MTTILQISDPHLMSHRHGTLYGVPTVESCRRVLQRARREVADPARVILTGDLSHEHTIAGYELLQELLGDWSERAWLIPGNHDDRAGLRSVFALPGEADHEILFRHELEDWLLLGIDTQLPGTVEGELSERVVETVRAWLSDDAERPKLLFMHHPPASVNTPWIDRLGLRDPQRLEMLVQAHPSVRGIFCGHVHQVFAGQFAGIPFYSAPSTAFQFVPGAEVMQFDDEAPGFRIIDLEGSTFSTRVVRLPEMPYVPSRNAPVRCAGSRPAGGTYRRGLFAR